MKFQVEYSWDKFVKSWIEADVVDGNTVIAFWNTSSYTVCKIEKLNAKQFNQTSLSLPKKL